MLIEKIINTFDYIKHVGNGESEYRHCREEMALDEAVTIMQKYQKIKHIISKWDAGIYDDEGLCDAEVLEMIGDEVYENGNAD